MAVLLDEHPLWEPLTALMFKQISTGAKHKRPTPRLEVREPGTPAFRTTLLAIEIECAVCSHTIHPVRERNGRGSAMYVTVTCDNDVRPGCCRHDKGRVEYDRIVAKFDGTPHGAVQKDLFGVFK